jgi:hypothetical protein
MICEHTLGKATFRTPVTLSTINPRQTGLEMNPALCIGRLATSACLSLLFCTLINLRLHDHPQILPQHPQADIKDK